MDNTDITSLSKSDLRDERRDMGMIFQEYGLVERLTVMENVLSGRLGYLSTWNAFRRNFSPEDVRQARATLDRVGMAGHDDPADELSAGQRQRVGIARAVVQRPKILLVDEPTSSLDPETSHTVMALLTDIAAEEDIPVLINIHDPQRYAPSNPIRRSKGSTWTKPPRTIGWTPTTSSPGTAATTRLVSASSGRSVRSAIGLSSTVSTPNETSAGGSAFDTDSSTTRSNCSRRGTVTPAASRASKARRAGAVRITLQTGTLIG